ncbi:hypothetical protein [Endozoicomonas sp. Mp262]|uniref:hypothetical protein n=1 Tax=Endozoicomonas sp. Mp262 TaxID=2919499 RepID=UPI0021DAE7A6
MSLEIEVADLRNDVEKLKRQRDQGEEIKHQIWNNMQEDIHRLCRDNYEQLAAFRTEARHEFDENRRRFEKSEAFQEEVKQRLDKSEAFQEETGQRFDRLEDRMDQKFEQTDQRLGRLEADVSTLKTDVSDMKSDISEIKAILLNKH